MITPNTKKRSTTTRALALAAGATMAIGLATGAQATAQDIAPGGQNPLPDCGVNAAAPEIVNNIWQVPAPSVDGSWWEYKGDSNYDPCVTLTYATIEQMPQGNAQYQNQLMLFFHGKFVGVGSDSVQQHDVIGFDDTNVTVRYKDYDALRDAGAPFAEAGNYTTDVTYHWDGEKVVPMGRIPNL